MRGGLGRYVARRAGLAVLTVVGVASLAFLMTKLLPGDEAQIAAGPEATADQVAAVRARLGLDAALPVQYARFLWRLAQGDLGTSLTSFRPVLHDLLEVLPATIELVACASLYTLLVAIPAATLAAAARDHAADKAGRVLATVLGGLPAFWFALMLQYLVGSHWGVLPISGQQSFGFFLDRTTGMPVLDALIAGQPAAALDALAHLVLPAIALGSFYAAQLFRTLRASMIGALRADFIPPVRAKGASRTRILLRHALPNAAGPGVILAGIQVGLMMGSAVLVEGIFARPGVGSYLANAVANKDTFAVLGSVVFIGAVVAVVNLGVDLVQLLIDPRIRAAEARR